MMMICPTILANFIYFSTFYFLHYIAYSFNICVISSYITYVLLKGKSRKPEPKQPFQTLNPIKSEYDNRYGLKPRLKMFVNRDPPPSHLLPITSYSYDLRGNSHLWEDKFGQPVVQHTLRITTILKKKKRWVSSY